MELVTPSCLISAQVSIKPVLTFSYNDGFLSIKRSTICSLTLPELSNMSFEDIMKLQNKVGTKVYNEVAYGSNKSQVTGKKKRLNKNR